MLRELPSLAFARWYWANTIILILLAQVLQHFWIHLINSTRWIPLDNDPLDSLAADALNKLKPSILAMPVFGLSGVLPVLSSRTGPSLLLSLDSFHFEKLQT